MLPPEIEAMRGEALQRQHEFVEARGGATAFVHEVRRSKSRVLKPLLVGLHRVIVAVIESGERLAQTTRNLLPHQDRVPADFLRSLLGTATENVAFFDRMLKERERLIAHHRPIRAYWTEGMRSKMESLREEFRGLRDTLTSGLSARVAEQVERYCAAALRQATIEQLEDGSWYASVPGFQGVWADAPTEDNARSDLAAVLREWISLKLADNDCDLPIVEGVDLNEALDASGTSADQPL